MPYTIKKATLADAERISQLISASVWALSTGDYSDEQIATALQNAWGLDTQLLHDQTYFCIWTNEELAGCGGWSFRKTLFGSDNREDRDTGELDPAVDAAKIRAFFIHPDHARKGLGSLLLQHCELAAWNAGFRKLEMGATLPGMRLYQEHGYRPGESLAFPTSDTTSIEIIPMYKTLTSMPVLGKG